MPIASGKRAYGRKGAEETRAALMDAGRSLFARRGFDGATVEMIARRAQVNKAMINYHFGGKAGLYAAILESTFGAISDRLEAIRSSDLPADRLLPEFLRTFSDLVQSHPDFPAMILREVLSEGRHLEDRILPHFMNVFGAARVIIEKGIGEGTLRPVDPLITYLILNGSLVFFFSTEPFRRRMIAEGRLPVELPSPDDFVHHLETLMLRGLRATPPKGS